MVLQCKSFKKPNYLLQSVAGEFEHRASEAAEGCFVSVAAKLVKIAIKIPLIMRMKLNQRQQIWDIMVRFHLPSKTHSEIHASGNKSSAANLGHFGAISYALKNSF